MPKPNNSTAPQPFPILIGDIGGTNARFSILTDAYAEPKQFPNVRTADFATIDEAIQQGVLDKTAVQPRSAILAVAGPINDDEIPLTNCDWVVRPKTMIEGLGMEDVLVVNDFEAQALAIAALSDENRERIGDATGDMIASASCSDRAPASASAGSCMPSTAGSRFPAKAAMSISTAQRARL